jgi:hypothetical protein
MQPTINQVRQFRMIAHGGGESPRCVPPRRNSAQVAFAFHPLQETPEPVPAGNRKRRPYEDVAMKTSPAPSRWL